MFLYAAIFLQFPNRWFRVNLLNFVKKKKKKKLIFVILAKDSSKTNVKLKHVKATVSTQS